MPMLMLLLVEVLKPLQQPKLAPLKLKLKFKLNLNLKPKLLLMWLRKQTVHQLSNSLESYLSFA